MPLHRALAVTAVLPACVQCDEMFRDLAELAVEKQLWAAKAMLYEHIAALRLAGVHVAAHAVQIKLHVDVCSCAASTSTPSTMGSAFPNDIVLGLESLPNLSQNADDDAFSDTRWM